MHPLRQDSGARQRELADAGGDRGSIHKWERDRVVAKYWCDKMRDILSRRVSAVKLGEKEYNPQLPLPGIWRPK